MKKYTAVKQFRCTKQESVLIDDKARNERKSTSAYLRDCALSRNIPEVDEKTRKILKDLAENELRIGVNINQVARLCNTRKGAALSDLEILRKSLVLLLDGRKQIVKVLKEMGNE